MRRILAPTLAFTLICAAALAEDHALVAYTVHDAASIPEPLTAAPADPERGAALAEAHCLACHAEGGASAPLAGVAARLGEGALRLAVVNLAIARPDIEGHAFHDAGAGEAAAAPALSAQGVEDVIAWLRAGAR